MRLLVLSSPDLGRFQLAALAPLFESNAIGVVAACVDGHTPPSAFAKLRREWRKGRGGYVLVQALGQVARLLRREPSEPAAAYFAERGVPVLRVEDLCATETLDFIRRWNPDCIFRTGFGIIREPLLSLPPKGVLSFHHGDIRRYRGQPPAFWELYHGEPEMGVTVQVLNDVLDAGRIVKEIRVPIRSDDGWKALRERAFAASEGMVHEACLLLEDPSFEPTAVPDSELGVLYTSPNLRQWVRLQARVAGRKLRARLLRR